uniref:GDP-D-glucose phosphorylase 1 n=1 Tax=Setaria digitata TaxID=48799 RepID=A0A915PMB5_9BILA
MATINIVVSGLDDTNTYPATEYLPTRCAISCAVFSGPVLLGRTGVFPDPLWIFGASRGAIRIRRDLNMLNAVGMCLILTSYCSSQTDLSVQVKGFNAAMTSLFLKQLRHFEECVVRCFGFVLIYEHFSMSHMAATGSSSGTRRFRPTVELPIEEENVSSTSLFTYSASDFIYDLRTPIAKDIDCRSKFEDLLMSKWEDAEKCKLLNYDLNCMYKLLEGNFNFSVQLNVERGERRRKPMHFRAVREPFSNLRWNFMKLKQKEILLHLQRKDHLLSNNSSDRHVVAVNAAPLGRGHSLLLPSINRCEPQILSETAVRLATDTMLLAKNNSFHVLFNSLLALASINHLHLHLLTWPYESDLINRRCEHLYDDIYVIKRPIWFAYTIVFQLTGPEQYEKSITRCADYLSTHEVAHNIFFSRAQPLRTSGAVHSEDTTNVLPQLVTAYIFPRVAVIGAKPAKSFSPASLELSGCMTAYTYQFFETVTEEGVLRIIDEEATLSDSRFNQICSELIDVLSGKVLVEHSFADKGEQQLSSPELDELHDSFQTFEVHSPRHFFPADCQQFTFEGESKRADAKPGGSL